MRLAGAKPIRINYIVLLSISAIVLLACRTSSASPDSPASDCYCSLKQDFKSTLVRAEVIAVGETYDIELIGDPFCSMSYMLFENQQLSGLVIGENAQVARRLEVGDIGLFSLDLDNGKIVSLKIEEGGLLMCEGDEDFPGATSEQVSWALLSFSCDHAVHELGVQEYKGGSDSYMCGCNMKSYPAIDSALLLLGAFAILLYIRRE